MREMKDTVRSLVRIGYDGLVHKIFRGTNARERFENEVAVLSHLESQSCNWVPQIVEAYPEELKLITTNCGSPVEKLSEKKQEKIFDSLEKEFGVRHDDPFLRNITYSDSVGRFCVIDFELAEITSNPSSDPATPNTLDSLQTLRWASATDVGRFRKVNQDARRMAAWVGQELIYLPAVGSFDLSCGDVYLVVCDGMGGAQFGERASQLALDSVFRALPAALKTGYDDPKLFAHLLSVAHEAIKHEAAIYEECQGMGTTLSLLKITKKEGFLAHVGDSRIYRSSKSANEEGKGLRQLSEDHSRLGKLLREGKINERQFKTDPKRSIISQALAARVQQITPQLDSVPIKQGERYLLCTDGLSDGLWDKEIASAMVKEESLHHIVDFLMERSLRASGRDNITLILAEVS